MGYVEQRIYNTLWKKVYLRSITQDKLQINFAQTGHIGLVIHSHEVIIHVFIMAAYLEIQRKEKKGLSLCVSVCS